MLEGFGVVLVLAGLYVLLAYLIVPAIWSHYDHEPGLRELNPRTATREGIPGDPLNVGVVGTQSDLVSAMRAAGWSPADPITLRTSIEITESVLFDRPDPYAPVSNLYYDGRRQDLAFEKQVGRSAEQRHHVRFWRVLEAGKEGRPVWLGAATFDRGVGFSRYTGQMTHHIKGDVDAERDRLMADLTRAGMLSVLFRVSGIGPTLRARNGGGDLFYTDGDIVVGVLNRDAVARVEPPQVLASPNAMELKNIAWRKAAALMRAADWFPD
jgi:hypothetical protein